MSDRPSQYDKGEDNWHAQHQSFDDWLRAEKPHRGARRIETAKEKNKRFRDDPKNFEPEFV